MSEIENNSYQPKVSVIVAAYNAEKTLAKCLDSILNQTMSDFEVVVVDDGSTDDTGAICDMYSKCDDRIRAFHNTNHGIGYTRRFGIDNSKGKYVIHVDSDDWIEPDMLHEMYGKAVYDNADMVICDMVEHMGSTTKISCQKPSDLDWKSVILDILNNKLHAGPCNKLVRLSCFANGINYESGLNFGEDTLVNVRLLAIGISVSYFHKAFYHYDRDANPKSASKQTSLDSIVQREQMIASIRNVLPQSEYSKAIDNKLVPIAFTALKSNIYDKNEYLARYDRLANLKWTDYSKSSPLPYRIIIWSSCHLSYGVARLLLAIKELYGRFANLCKI